MISLAVTSERCKFFVMFRRYIPIGVRSPVELYHPLGGGGRRAVGLPTWALELGPSESVVLLFTIEMTLNHALGKWYHFIKLTHRIKNFFSKGEVVPKCGVFFGI